MKIDEFSKWFKATAMNRTKMMNSIDMKKSQSNCCCHKNNLFSMRWSQILFSMTKNIVTEKIQFFMQFLPEHRLTTNCATHKIPAICCFCVNRRQ